MPKNQAVLQPVKAGYPLQIVATDTLGPLPKSKNGNMYVLVASDYFTHLADVYDIPNQEAKAVTKTFRPGLTSEMCKVLKICKSCNTPYHPQGHWVR